MNEDDTFEALRRTPLNKLFDKDTILFQGETRVDAFIKIAKDPVHSGDIFRVGWFHESIVEHLNDNGWSEEEFITTIRKLAGVGYDPNKQG
jgi:hypothetical protein